MTTHHQKRELLRLSRSGHIRKLQRLLGEDVDVNFLHRSSGMTPLMAAANAGHAAVVDLLLRQGADPNLRADDNASALHWACKYGDAQIVDMLIDAGADLNVRRASDSDDDGPAPIHMAIYKCPDELADDIAIRLVAAGASVDIEYLGRTVLQYAQWHNRDGLAAYLRKRGVRQ